tara:strand:+ start:3254 stop:4087 length:834 start_codon:yes stop_codon:yes gene_type:complete
MHYLKRIYKRYDNEGIEALVYYYLKKFGIKVKYNSFLDKKKKIISKKIFEICKGKVTFGLYKGTKLFEDENNIESDYSSKLLGVYEEQIQIHIIRLQKKYNLKYIINFGSAEGFHIISLIKKKIFLKGLAFEIDSYKKLELKKNILLNNLIKKIKILGKANFDDVNKEFNKNVLKKTLYLVDIEGAEFLLFNKFNYNFFQNSVLIIEDHNFAIKNKSLIKVFYKFLNKNFSTKIVNNAERNPFKIKKIKEFNDDEKWLMMSENRPKNMQWIVCEPKN